MEKQLVFEKLDAFKRGKIVRRFNNCIWVLSDDNRTILEVPTDRMTFVVGDTVVNEGKEYEVVNTFMHKGNKLAACVSDEGEGRVFKEDELIRKYSEIKSKQES